MNPQQVAGLLEADPVRVCQRAPQPVHVQLQLLGRARIRLAAHSASTSTSTDTRVFARHSRIPSSMRDIGAVTVPSRTRSGPRTSNSIPYPPPTGRRIGSVQTAPLRTFRP